MVIRGRTIFASIRSHSEDDAFRMRAAYRLACRSGHMVGLGSSLSSFCRNRVGEIAVKRKFQASNLELFKTFIGARLENLIKRASIARTYHDDDGEFDLN